ncbi:MAG: site-2 protease family protein [Helicobacteraceae bacterium]|nr:site-2 protease family protein [Helicobacteraceae bacterium]
MESIDLFKIVGAILALLVAIIGHEIMHGLIAYKYGDITAKDAGRLSINPIVHIDLFGSIIVPSMMYFIPMLLGAESGLLFGWAKPVPVNMRTVINSGGYNAAMQVDLAGIFYNLVVATVASIAIMSMSSPTSADSLSYIFLYIFITQLLLINVVLAVFNILPIPQFDGANFLIHLSLKLKINPIAEFFMKAEPYGMIIVLVILITPIKEYVLFMPIQMLLKALLS